MAGEGSSSRQVRQVYCYRTRSEEHTSELQSQSKLVCRLLLEKKAKHEWMALTAPHLATLFGWSDHYRALQADSDHRRAPKRSLARAIIVYEDGGLSVTAIATL